MCCFNFFFTFLKYFCDIIYTFKINFLQDGSYKFGIWLCTTPFVITVVIFEHIEKYYKNMSSISAVFVITVVIFEHIEKYYKNMSSISAVYLSR